MKKIIAILYISFFVITMYANKDTLSKKNSVYLNIGGVSYHYSIDYERYIILNNKFKLSSSLGIGMVSSLHIPLKINIRYRIHKSVHTEFLIGASYIKGLRNVYDKYSYKDTYPSENIYFTSGLGIKFQKNNKGMFLSLGIANLSNIYTIKNKYYYIQQEEYSIRSQNISKDELNKFIIPYWTTGVSF